MRILFLSRWFPYPADNGAKIRIYNVLRGLARRHEVRLISFVTEAITEDDLAHMRTICSQIETVPYREFRASSLKSKLGFLSPVPRSFADTYHEDFAAKVEQAGRDESFDLVIGSQWDTIPYMLNAPSLQHTPKLLEEVELSIYRKQIAMATSSTQRLRKQMMWDKWRYFMNRSLAQIDACTVVSKPEVESILECRPGYAPIGVIPNGADIEYFTGDFGPAEPNSVVYTGAMTYYVNFEAMKWFLGEIWPRVTSQVPDAKLYMCGKYTGVPVEQLPQYDNAILGGYYPDIRPRIAQSTVSIVPELLGGGTRIKVLEAMALGTPVVSTQSGANGLNLTDGHDILITDEPNAFADSVVRVLKDAALRRTLSRNGRATIEAKYDWRVIGDQLNDFIAQVVDQAKVLSR